MKEKKNKNLKDHGYTSSFYTTLSRFHTHSSECFIGGAISLAPPAHRTSIALNFHRPCSHCSLPSHPFPVFLRRNPSIGLARIAPFRTLMCVSLFDIATSACSFPCVAVFLSSILPQLCRFLNALNSFIFIDEEEEEDLI
ncbi:uncharacterized protein LOC110272103 [Arachis ipaensis]|uniref:uncharacterized protein LOC110272103 n=1 Tax=Arachis ipaensis TaxID=130454 RepID=UPI000A2B6C8C|nr:uncharacterized protein LOC110272103 [Arachis ipaensis]